MAVVVETGAAGVGAAGLVTVGVVTVGAEMCMVSIDGILVSVVAVTGSDIFFGLDIMVARTSH